MAKILLINPPLRKNTYLTTHVNITAPNYPSLTLVGGAHITALPEEAVRERCFDVIVCGEGDTVIPELLSARSFKEVPGIFCREKDSGELKYTTARKRLRDLNALPFPAWGLFEIHRIIEWRSENFIFAPHIFLGD